MNTVGVEVAFDLLVRNVVGDEFDVAWDVFRRVFLTLHESEIGPFRVFFPELENGFGALECAATGEVEKRLVIRQ